MARTRKAYQRIAVMTCNTSDRARATHSRSKASNEGATLGALPPEAASASWYLRSASPAMAALMSLALRAAPRSARGMARLPVFERVASSVPRVRFHRFQSCSDAWERHGPEHSLLVNSCALGLTLSPLEITSRRTTKPKTLYISTSIKS